MERRRSVYMDHAATTPTRPEVVEAMLPCFTERFGNPSSIYALAREAQVTMERARGRVAEAIGARPENIFFTSGGTEADNWAIKGVAAANRKRGDHIVTSSIEHHAVLHPCQALEKQGYRVTYLPVDEFGLVDPAAVEEAITDKTILVSVMAANNEIGTVQPIREAAEIVHDRGGLLHVDATDAAGRIPIDVEREGIDLLTLSGNQLGGPNGVGALYIRPGVRVQPILVGGGQERGLRPGTENVVGIACMGEAARLAGEEMPEESRRLRAIRDSLIAGITAIEEARLTGHPTERLAHHASFRFARIEGESIQLAMDMFGIAVATGSACTSRTLEASHVLVAIGLAHDEAHGSMVATLGRENSEGEVPRIVRAVGETVKRLRAITPL